MRTPEVEKAISNTKAGMYCTDDADTLAAEVERLEARVAVAGQSIDELQAALNTQQARVAELEEFRIMQLAAISTATLQNTVKSTADRISPGSPYSTVAYVDVCKAVDREMRERQRAEAAEARVKELEVVRDALIRSEESAHQMEELLTNQAQEYIERAEAAEQRAEESERAFGLLEEAHKATTAKFAEMMQRVKELEALEPKRAQFDSDHCMHVLVPHDKYEQMERAETRLRELQAGDYEKLEAQNARLRAAQFEARDATATARGFMREAESMIASMVRTDDPMGYLVTGTAVRDNLRTGIKIIEDKWKLSEDLKAALSGEEAST